jgi:hypothetical protein
MGTDRPAKPYMPVTLRKEYKWVYVGSKWRMIRKMSLTGTTD